jgi:hypothetical protein
MKVSDYMNLVVKIHSVSRRHVMLLIDFKFVLVSSRQYCGAAAFSSNMLLICGQLLNKLDYDIYATIRIPFVPVSTVDWRMPLVGMMMSISINSGDE